MGIRVNLKVSPQDHWRRRIVKLLTTHQLQQMCPNALSNRGDLEAAILANWPIQIDEYVKAAIRIARGVA